MAVENKVVDIQVLNVEEYGPNVLVCYSKVYRNGEKKACRTHVRDLGGYYRFFSPKPIVAAEFLGKVYLGYVKNDCRLLFIVKLEDRSAQLIQVKEGSEASLKLLQISRDQEDCASATAPRTQGSGEPAKPYPLGKNELPQGQYVIGQDIPAGTYDFFVVYGNGGIFELAKYEENGKIAKDTLTFFWVGLKEDYEKRELVHIQCKEGYTLTIKNNVIMKIAKSKRVKIEL